MPDENERHEAEGHAATPSDLVRLKHQLGKSITWGKSNLNALQIEELTKLSREDYARIRKEYADWQRHMNVINTYVLVAIVLGCVLMYFFVPYGWMRVAAALLGFSCFYALCKREGHADGYIDGYDAGHEAGIHKALGVQPTEMKEMHTMATDMKIDEMVVERMDERDEGKKTTP